ncbi:PKD domain-containing protein [bacterium]|nr:PKD domain-containing protein [bacterium]
MKRHYLITLLLGLLCSVQSNAQITSYPYIEDFEDFTTLQTGSSCDLSNDRISASGWLQDSTDDADWRPDTAGTASNGTGPGSTDSTTGVGVGTDVNPGTTNGIYLYMEATPNGTSCADAVGSIYSPIFDFSAANKHYRVRLYYHMHGGALGNLSIDAIIDEKIEVNDLVVITGDQGENWKEMIVNVGNINADSVRFRIKATMGSAFSSDIAIDQFKVEEYTPPRFDPLVVQANYFPKEYPILSIKHFAPVNIYTTVKNEGLLSANNCEATVNFNSYNDTLFLGSIGAFETIQDTFSQSFMPENGTPLSLPIKISSSDPDSFSSNNEFMLPILVSDTVIAREDGETALNGIGIGGATGQIGQKFTLVVDDTLTSVTFFINNPNNTDSVRVHLYDFDPSSGPSNLLASSTDVDYVSYRERYTVRFDCEQILSAGDYFVAVEQLSTTNMSLGYNPYYHTPQTTFYSTGGAWNTLDNDFSLSLMIRMNFGKKRPPDISISTASDTVCSGQQFFLSGQGASSYTWSPTAGILAPTSATTPASFNSSRMVYCTGVNQCGIAGVDSIYIYAEPAPVGTITSDQTVCRGETVTLQASGGDSYTWLGGPSNSDYTVQALRDTAYAVRIDSSNGCSKNLLTRVYASFVDVVAEGDTSLCAGGIVTLSSSGADSLIWRDGPETPDYAFMAQESKTYIVDGYNSLNCTDSASVFVEVYNSPDLELTNDTGACFRDSITLIARGAQNYEWTDGPTDSFYRFRVITSDWYYLRAFNDNGCEAFDSVFVQRHLIPFAQVSNDTTICEGQNAQIKVTGGIRYEWNDGSTDAIRNVSPKFATVFRAKALNDFGCFSEDSLRIDVNPLPRADFDVFVEFDSIKLTNLSEDYDTWLWRFGDGDSSDAEDPSHIYTSEASYNITLTVTNACGSSDTSITVQIEIPVDNIEESKLLSNLNIYPNPGTGVYELKLNTSLVGEMKLKLYDSKGAVVWSNTIIKTQNDIIETIDISDLDAGMYWLELKLGVGSTGRILIKH